MKASIASVASGGYGVHFDTSKKTSFISFNDSPTVGGTVGQDGIAKGDGIYESGVDTILNTYSVQNGNIIEGLCILQAGTCKAVSNLDITFVRPNPDATIRGLDPTQGSEITGSEAMITVETSLHDKCRVVTVGISGDISVPTITTTNSQCTP